MDGRLRLPITLMTLVKPLVFVVVGDCLVCCFVDGQLIATLVADM